MRAVIVNPASASGRTAARWRRIVAALEVGGEHLEVLLTTGPGEARALARRVVSEGVRGLVVLGGDGTVGEVVAGCVRPDGSGVAATGVELSIIHQGTGGDLARGLGVPKDEAGAVATALHGTVRAIDVGVARYALDDEIGVTGDAAPSDDAGRPAAQLRAFASCANVGMAAEVVARVQGPLKRFGNNAAFAVATVSCLARNRARPVRVSTSTGLDAVLDLVDIDVCNNRFMGGGMLVAPEAVLDDGAFDVVLISGAGRLRLIRTFPKIYSGRHVHDGLVRVERTPDIAIEAVPGAIEGGVVLDGELVGRTPARFTVLPRAIGVRVPG